MPAYATPQDLIARFGPDEVEQLSFGRRRQVVVDGLDADDAGGAALVAHVRLRGRIVTHQHHRIRHARRQRGE